jgi:hypothetical protein
MTNNLNFPIAVSLLFMTIFSNCFGQGNIINSITFVQGDSIYNINKNSDSVKLERKPFSIRYFCKQYDSKNEKFYSAQVATLDNPYDTLILKIGQKTKDIPYFEPGTGMAPGENGMYETIFISNSGHHYLTYENEKDKRVFKISKHKEVLELEWKISDAFYDEKEVQFSELKISTLYFVFFIDNNLNEIIDNDELKVITAKFK